MAQVMTKQMQKIEELTLYIIGMKKEHSASLKKLKLEQEAKDMDILSRLQALENSSK